MRQTHTRQTHTRQTDIIFNGNVTKISKSSIKKKFTRRIHDRFLFLSLKSPIFPLSSFPSKLAELESTTQFSKLKKSHNAKQTNKKTTLQLP